MQKQMYCTRRLKRVEDSRSRTRELYVMGHRCIASVDFVPLIQDELLDFEAFLVFEVVRAIFVTCGARTFEAFRFSIREGLSKVSRPGDGSNTAPCVVLPNVSPATEFCKTGSRKLSTPALCKTTPPSELEPIPKVRFRPAFPKSDLEPEEKSSRKGTIIDPSGLNDLAYSDRFRCWVCFP